MSSEERLVDNIPVDKKLGSADHKMVKFTIKVSILNWEIFKLANFLQANICVGVVIELGCVL